MAHRDLRPRDLVTRPLPTLLTGRYHTTHSAIQRGVSFEGHLQQWSSFTRDARRTFVNETWNTSPISSALTLPGVNIDTERVVIGDEHGMQGRFNQHVGQAMSTILEAQNISLHFGDFKGAIKPRDDYSRVPDFTVMDPAGVIKVVGEGKGGWVDDHNLAEKVQEYERGGEGEDFRKTLGQIARYMLDTDVKYGFLTTYTQSILLRKMDINGQWTLEYSPVIHHDDSWSQANGKISVRQAFYHIIRLAQGDGRFNNSSGQFQLWTVPS